MPSLFTFNDESDSFFLTPDQPECALIDLIHRGHDGYISFHRQHPDNPDGLQNLCSMPARTLPGLFDQLIEDVETDSYFSINAFWRGKRWSNRRNYRDSTGALMPTAHREGKDVRWLTACFADIDCEAIGVTVGTAIGTVIQHQDDGLIPPASIITRSGRGIWLFWLLTGQDYSTPTEHARAWPEKVNRWAEIQVRICNELARIGADAVAKDVSRITRIPGSINSKVNKRVAYWLQADASGRVPTYTMTELARAFGLDIEPKRVPALFGRVTNIYQQRASKGQAGRWLRARENFEKLWKLRKTFRVGTRNSAVFFYATILKCLPGQYKLEPFEIEYAVRELYRSLDQPIGKPYTLDTMKTTINSARRQLAGVRNQTIANALWITPDEAAHLKGWPAAVRFTGGPEPRTKLTRPELAQRRRTIIRQHVEALGGVPPSGDELRELVANAGLERPARATVLDDLRAMGINNPRSDAARNAAAEQDDLNTWWGRRVS